MDRWPNFFIAGVPKGGTSSLHAHLGQIPEVFMSRIKEPNYFSRVLVPDDHPVRPIRDEQAYLRLFSGVTTETVIGEASPTYLADPEAARLIRDVAPDARMLVSLRDPVERLYSHYLMMVNNGSAGPDFMKEIRRGLEYGHDRSRMLLRPEIGLYHGQLQRLLETSGENRVRVILFEEFAADPRGTLAAVLEFVGIDHSLEGFRSAVHRRYARARGPLARYIFGNRTIARVSEFVLPPAFRKAVREKLLVKAVAKPMMAAAARDFLREYYAEDVRSLERLLKRPLPWPNFRDPQLSA